MPVVRRNRLRRVLLAGLLGAVAAAGCAPKQRIPVGCVPEDVTIYVDGEALASRPAELVLRSDQPHTIFVKGEGYQPEMVVLESREEDGKPRLTPPEVCVQLRYVGVRRELQVEVEESGAEEAPAPPAQDR